MNSADSGDGFVEVIAREVEADPGNLALREDFVTLLLEQDLGRAATELGKFEAIGGDPGAAAKRPTRKRTRTGPRTRSGNR